MCAFEENSVQMDFNILVMGRTYKAQHTRAVVHYNENACTRPQECNLVIEYNRCAEFSLMIRPGRTIHTAVIIVERTFPGTE